MSERERRNFRASQLIWLLVGVLEVLIALRIGLKLIAATPDNPFAAFIYNLTNIFVFPFAGLTPTPAVGSGVLELHSIIAMVVYALAGWAIARLVWVIFYRRREPVDVTQTTIQDDRTE
ncbi:MAG TPA: YggT family protein [Anaerolineae bacterium]|nr:YggT family protein [Anaerolineae bacterium]